MLEVPIDQVWVDESTMSLGSLIIGNWSFSGAG
jgi:hypothetical protein